MKYWQCSVCKYIHQGDTPPEKCPICGVDSSKFIEIDEASVPQKTPPEKQMEKKPPAAVTVKKPPESKLKQAAAQEPKKENVQKGKIKFEQIKSLLVKHHAHPVSVHTPNGLLPAAALLLVIAWLFDTQLLEKAAIVNLVIVILALPFVVYTGILEWKTKYNGAMTPVFKIKILAASVTCAACAMSLIWYALNPDILSSSRSWVFILLNIIMLAGAGAAGHIGGKLVFKD